MLLLLTAGWPWLIMGGCLIALGNLTLKLTPKDWITAILSVPFWIFPEPTTQEKEEAEHQSAGELASNNPGCLFLVSGIIMIIYGCFRIFLFL